jgi:nitrite reductase/ring-hydroxylating ferredoxin subunit
MLAPLVGDNPAAARRGDEYFAIGAECTHYHGPLAQGLIVGDTVRCPWHHACFSLRTGEALHAPAFSPVECWSTEVRDGRVFVGGKSSPAMKPVRDSGSRSGLPERIVIVGGGAAGYSGENGANQGLSC